MNGDPGADILLAVVYVYVLMAFITGGVTGLRLRRPYFSHVIFGSNIYSLTRKQERIIKTRAFWAGLFWPVVAPVWVLGWAGYGLFKLVTVPFRKLDP